MATLLKLSNELLKTILAASPDILTALRLSSVNQRIHAIWLEHGDLIIGRFLKPNLSADGDAFLLTKVELELAESSRCPSSGSDQHSAMAGDLSVRACLFKLLHNAELCVGAHSACTACIDPLNLARGYLERHPSSPSSFYFLRRLVLAFEIVQGRPQLQREIEALSARRRFGSIICSCYIFGIT